MHKKKLIRKLAVYFYGFFIIYMPKFSDLLINVPIELFSAIVLCIISIPWLLKFKGNFVDYKIDNRIIFLIIGIILATTYFTIRAAMTSNDLRILQNLFVLVQIMHVIIIIDLLKSIGYQKDSMVGFLLNLGLIQGFICILMLIFPEFRTLALDLYYLGREENIFISRMRIYGISGDYTFFTPIYHGILASLAFYYSVFKSRKFLIYIPFILISILLNGRLGLLIFLLSPVIMFIYFLLKGKVLLNMVKYSGVIMLLVILFIFFLSIVSPFTYNWIVGGFEDTINLILKKSTSGNYVALIDTMLYFPNGTGLIFGEGHRVYSHHGIDKGYNASDIGYINDLFMGGFVYLIILYGSVFIFICWKNFKVIYKDKQDIYINTIFPLFLIAALLFANYKGEVMRGGTILLGAIFIKLILMQPSIKKKSSIENRT